MAVFADNFTGSDGTLLDAHTPDTGTSWTRLFGSTGTNAEIASNQLRSDGDLNSGVIYTADGTYPSADYDITFTLVGIAAQNDRPIFAMVRIQDQENMYAVRLEVTASESSLYKKVAGTWTAIGSLFTKPANASVCKLEIIGTALNFYDDGVSIASATVSDHAAAGKAGIGFGGGAELVAAGDDGSTSNIIDTLTVNNLGAGGAISGTASITLAGLARSAAGTVKVQGTSAKTLAALSIASAATVKVQGAAAKTLGALSAAAAGTVKIQGAVARTLATIAATIAGTVKVQAGLARTLAALTLQATITDGSTPAGGTSTRKVWESTPRSAAPASGRGTVDAGPRDTIIGEG